MNRRAFLFTSVAAATANGGARATSGLQVIYVGGQDCPPCRTFVYNTAAKVEGVERATFDSAANERSLRRDRPMRRSDAGDFRSETSSVPNRY